MLIKKNQKTRSAAQLASGPTPLTEKLEASSRGDSYQPYRHQWMTVNSLRRPRRNIVGTSVEDTTLKA